MQKKLIDTISQTVSLTETDIQLCNTYFELATTAKNSILEEQDKVPQYLYFIASGFMRLFYYDENGDEVTSHISSENNFFASFLSFVNQNKAKENVECITECELLRISRPDLVTLIDSSENFKKFSLIIFEQAIASTEIRANDLATLAAEHRYKKLMETQPTILQNVPIQYIASFLGIKPQSLSRIRRQIIM
jgi:CRP/FNR family transcriptional regulator, anaerobic regulatory protein